MSGIFKTLAVILSLLTLSACSDNAAKNAVIHKAVAMESSDECHLCGMLM